MERYDLAVLGTGPGGYIAAIRAAQLGMRVAAIERDRPGGVCLNWGCIPSKAILTSAELFDSIRNAGRYGITCEKTSLDYGAVIKRSRRAAEKLCKGVEFLFKKNKIRLITGEGRLTSAHSLEVRSNDEGGRPLKIEAERVLIASGSTEIVLPGIGIDGERVMTSREALVAKEIPGSIAIIGGGAIGVEFGYAYSCFGAEVTIIEMMEQLLPGTDAEIAKELERSFKKRKIRLALRTTFKGLEKPGGRLRVKLEGADGRSETIEVDQVLAAVGRRPLSDGIGLEETGVFIENGFIRVDEHLRTSVESVYAIGDVIGPPFLAHKASEEGIAAVEFMAGRREEALDYTKIAACIYCQPEVATIGLTEKQAGERGHKVRVGRFPFRACGKAVAAGHEEGFVKIVSDAKYGEILGCHVIGHGATELIAELGLARSLEATLTEIGRTVHAHPTMSEAVMEAALNARGQSLTV